MVSSLSYYYCALVVGATTVALFADVPTTAHAAGVPEEFDPDTMLVWKSNNTSGCSDDPLFRLNNKNKKSCAWISGMSKKNKKARLCGKNKVRNACPQTCGVPVEDCSTDPNGGGGPRGIKTECPRSSALNNLLLRGNQYNINIDSRDSVAVSNANANANAKYIPQDDNSWDCSEYVEGLMCFSDYRYSGCTDDSIKCSPTKKFVCDGKKWKIEWMPVLSCPPLVSNPPVVPVPVPATSSSASASASASATSTSSRSALVKALVGKPCDRKACPPSPPKVGSDCSEYEGGISECHYNYKITGCPGDGDRGCFPIEHYSCVSDYSYDNNNGGDERGELLTDVWRLSIFAMPPCPIAGQTRSYETCDPEQCPKTEPEDGADCSDYKGTDECNYDYRVTGCDEESRQCSPTKYYTCEEEPISNNPTFFPKKWKQNHVMVPACFLEGNGVSCDPDGCPVVPPEPGSDCSDFLENNNSNNRNSNSNSNSNSEQCLYRFRYSGCTLDDLQCVPNDFYFCDAVQHKWILKKLAAREIECPDTTTITNISDNNNDVVNLIVPERKQKMFYLDPSADPQRESKNDERLAILLPPDNNDNNDNDAGGIADYRYYNNNNNGDTDVSGEIGKPCTACPTVEPAFSCPPTVPRQGDPCVVNGYKDKHTCSYEFGYERRDATTDGNSNSNSNSGVAATEFLLECVPRKLVRCTAESGWVHRMH